MRTSNGKLQTEMAGLHFKNPVMAGCAGITATANVIERWLKAGAGGILAKSLTTDPALRSSIRPIFYPLSRHGLKGAMTESELLHHMDPVIWAETEAPKIARLCEEHEAVWIQSIVGRGVDHDDWANLARLVEQAGAHGIELDFGCPLAPGESEHYSSIELGEDPVISATLTAAVKRAVKSPVGVKLSPTIRRLDRVAAVCQAAGADFGSAVNAPAGFSVDVELEEIRGANTFVGYIPGPSLKWWGLWKVAQIKRACDLEISGVGGIFTANDALEYMLLGCPTVQLVSSVYFKGPQVFPEILEGIEQFMDRKGYERIEDFRGNVLRKLQEYRDVPHETEMALDPTPILPKFDLEKCNFCGQCVTSCVYDAISMNEMESFIDSDANKCFGCGFCSGICPTDAIQIVHVRTQEVVWTGQGALRSDWVNW